MLVKGIDRTQDDPPSLIASQHGMASLDGSRLANRMTTSVCAGHRLGGAPAGIEPATPSLPFVLPRSCNKAPAGQGTVSVRG